MENQQFEETELKRNNDKNLTIKKQRNKIVEQHCNNFKRRARINLLVCLILS